MSSLVTFSKTTTPDGIVVRVAAKINIEELSKYGVTDMPVVSLSRDGMKCRYDLKSMHEHKCWPIHKTPEAAAAYGDRIYKEIKEWCNENGVDLAGKKTWDD